MMFLHYFSGPIESLTPDSRDEYDSLTTAPLPARMAWAQ
jgi:hypothetical protein